MKSHFRRVLITEQLERRDLLAVDPGSSVWHNTARPLDTNNDTYVSPIDALLVINQLNTPSHEGVMPRRVNPLAPYLDTSGDRFVSPIDALLVINELNSNQGEQTYPIVRKPGGEELGPAGFISDVLLQVPGGLGESFEVTLNWDSANKSFYELGLFSVADSKGTIGEFSPTDEQYPFAAFSQPDKQVLFSHQDVYRETNRAVFGGGEWVSVYILQRTSNEADISAHIELEQLGSSQFAIRWQEVAVNSSALSPPFDDSVLTGIVRPINLNPEILSTPITLIGDSSDYHYKPEVLDAAEELLSFELLAYPPGMTIEPSGDIRWPANSTSVGAHYVELMVRDDRGGFSRQAFNLEVVPTLLNRPPVILSEPIRTIQVDGATDVYAEQVVSFNDWTPTTYLNYWEDAVWDVNRNSQEVTQTNTLAPSLLVSDFKLSNHRFEGMINSNYYFEGGYFGFVFGYQDDQNFYLFDWKQNDGDPNDYRGVALQGMSVKRFASATPLTEQDYWQTQVDPLKGETLFHNSLNWDRSEYVVTLEQTSERVLIEISSAGTVLETIDLSLPGLPDGKVGFYTNYQAPSTFSDFHTKLFGGEQYQYQIHAQDDDGDQLTYRLLESPRDMRLDEQTGRIVWQPTYQDVGDHSVVIEVSDPQGATAFQTFTLCVHPPASNGAPQIISSPNTEYDYNSRPAPYRYQVQAYDPEQDQLSYSLIDPPTGMRINSATGLIEWPYDDVWAWQEGGFFDAPRAWYAGHGGIADVTIQVHDSNGGVDTQTFELFAYSATPAMISGYIYEDVNRNGLLDSNFVEGDAPHIVFVVDNSCSMDDPFVGDRLGDLNGDDRFDTRFDAALAGISLFIERLAQDSKKASAQISLVGLDVPFDMDPQQEGFQYFIGIQDDNDGNGLPDFQDVFRHMLTYCGGTNYEQALVNAIEALDAETTAEDYRNVVFMTDGIPERSGPYEDDVQTLRNMGVNLQGLGIGRGTLTDQLKEVDPTAHEIAYTKDLWETFGGLDITGFEAMEPVLEGWTVYLDQNHNAQLDAGETSTLSDSNGYYEFGQLAVGEQYQVRTVIPTGWSQLTPQRGNYTAIMWGGEQNRAFNFGNVQALGLSDDLPPVFHSTAPTEVVVGQTFRYDALASDPESSGITYQLVLGPSNASLQPVSGRLFWHPTAEDRGNHNFIIRAIDSAGNGTNQTFTATVRDVNTAPAVTSVPPADWPVGERTEYQLKTQDADGDEVSVRVVDGPADLLFDEVTRTLSWTPDPTYTGIVLSDGPIAYWNFDEVTNLTHFPDVTGNGYEAVADRTVSLATSPIGENHRGINTEAATISVPSATAMPLREFTFEAWVKSSPTSNNTSIISGWNHFNAYGIDLFQGGYTDSRFSFTGASYGIPQPLDQWRYLVGTFSDQAIRLYVDGQLVDERESIHPWDPRGGFEIALMQGWEGDIDEIAIYDYPLTPKQIESHFNSALQQPRVVTIEVSDTGGAATIHSFEIYPDENYHNLPPTVTSSLPQRVPVGQQLVHQVTAADSSGDSFSYSLLDAPTGMAIDPSGIVRWSPTSNQLGVHTVLLEVTDLLGASSTNSATIAVVTQESNSPPSIISNPASHASVAQTFTYSPEAYDKDGDALLWTLVDGPSGTSIDSRTGNVHWTPTFDQLGSNQFQIAVHDAFGMLDTQKFTVTASCFNAAPQILSIPSTRAFVDQVYSYQLEALDGDGDPLTWTLSAGPADMSINKGNLLHWTPAPSQLGIHVVHIEVSDGTSSHFQTYQLEVVDPAVANRAPVVTSEPKYSARTGNPYSYQLTAVDPDGGVVSYSTGNQLPTGMMFSESGLLSWEPTLAQAGEHLVSLVATDSQGLTSTQAFFLVVEENLAPVITSQPLLELTAGAEYRYLIKAHDPERADVRFLLENGPEGMQLDALGGLRWQSSVNSPTPAEVSVSVVDQFGLKTTQNWQIELQPDIEPPVAQVTVISGIRNYITDATLDVGSIYQVRVSGSDNVSIASYQLSVDGEIVALDQQGFATIAAGQVGDVQLVGTVTDPSGLSGSNSLNVNIQDPAIRNAPVPTDPTLPPNPGLDPTDFGIPLIEITSPEGASTVSNLVPIIGTVDDPEDNLWFYRVYYARADRIDMTQLDMDDPDWVILQTSTQEVHNGELAVFDTTQVSNDPYAIAVAAFDVNGLGYIQPTLIYVEGNVDVGVFELTVADLSIPLAGIPIQVNRTYSTHDALDQGDFGFGWTLGIADARIFEAAAVGAGGVFTPGNDKFVPDRTKVYLTNPQGNRVGFTYKEKYQTGCSSLFGCLFGAAYTPYFEPDPGVYDTLTIDENRVFRGGVAGALGQGINPEFYTLTTKDGVAYRYSDQTGLQTIRDRSGNVVTLTATSLEHSSGQAIEFQRDDHGRISVIVDPAGNEIIYEYDSSGNLRTVTDQVGIQTSYEYRDDIPQYLDKAYNSLGTRVFKVQYDEDGKYVGIVDALGNSAEQNFETNANTGVVRDVLGNATTFFYDDRGNVLREIDPAGNETLRTYDDSRNPDLETRIVDRNNNISERAYDERGNILSITEFGSDTNPLDRPEVTTFAYDSNNVQAITNAAGHTTTFHYDASGLLTQISNALGDSSNFSYDDLGRRASFSDFNGNVTSFEYDGACPCGSPSRVVFADGTYQSFQYNHFGQVTEEAYYEASGTLAQIKQTDYDDVGRPVEERQGLPGDPNHPQTIVRKFYTGHLLDWEVVVHPESLDPDGKLLESPATPVTERKSRITSYEYDAADRMIRQIDAEGGIVEFRYDAAGNRILLQDPVGNITTWIYDALHRVAEERDPFYNAGWAIDRAIAELANPSGVDVTTNTAADHVRAYGYDGEGNQVEVIDRNGRRREFDYDQAGRLLAEQWFTADTNELVEEISFGYDVLGNMLTASDSTSNYLYTYDALNRMTSVDNNPDGTLGVPRVILSYAYDAQGNVLATSDDAGVTVASEYDARNRLAVRTWFDAIVSDGDQPDVESVRVEFDYNAAGRESEVSRYSGLDSSNLVGRTLRTYDSVGRSDLLNHLNATDELLAGYDYDYDFGSLVTHESRSHQNSDYAQEIDYGYDLTGQLVEALFTGQEDEHFEYDLNGNRITSSLGDSHRSYTTGLANQLTSDSVYRYEYDGEGNQIKRVHLTSGETRTMQYDHYNRLVRVDDWSSDPGDPANPESGAVLLQTVEYTYDAHGRRIARIVDTDGIGSQPSTREAFVYNTDNVWVDFDRGGIPTSRYVFRDRVDSNIARQSDDGLAWFLTDKLGSLGGVVTNDGKLHGQISYEAFGGPEYVGQSVSLSERYLFTGREYDPALQSYYYRARSYSARLGVFLQVDPLGFDANDPNLTRYVGNSPVNGIDPSGQLVIVERTLLDSRTGVATRASIERLGKRVICRIGNLVVPLNISPPPFPGRFEELVCTWLFGLPT